MSPELLFALKLTVTPILVAGMSLVARRFGPTVGGLLMGLPWMTGPVLFFATFQYGNQWLAQASVGVVLATAAIAAYMLAYGHVAQRASWRIALPAAALAFVLAAVLLTRRAIGIELAAALSAMALLATFALLPRLKSEGLPGPLPWWDIPMRMVVAALMVTVISIVSGHVSPEMSGLVASFPVILTSVGTFTHHRWGPDAVVRLLRGLSLSLLSFIAFFWVVAGSAVSHGVVVSYAMAALVALAISAALVAASRLRLWR